MNAAAKKIHWTALEIYCNDGSCELASLENRMRALSDFRSMGFMMGFCIGNPAGKTRKQAQESGPKFYDVNWDSDHCASGRMYAFGTYAVIYAQNEHPVDHNRAACLQVGIVSFMGASIVADMAQSRSQKSYKFAVIDCLGNIVQKL